MPPVLIIDPAPEQQGLPADIVGPLGAGAVPDEEPDEDVDNADANMTERAASSIPIEIFDSAKDDFDDWIERFESAVALATNAQSADRKNILYLTWLPLKLDPAARGVLRQIPATTVYATANGVKGVKELLKELLVDPGDVYRWRAMKKKITWDGKECFQSLATKVIRAVDKFEKELDQNARNSSYFFRFREALPKVYQDSIDVTIGKDEQTIENAKELAGRVKLTRPDHEVTFECAAMSDSAVADNRVHGLELQISELGTKLDNLSVSVAGADGGKDRSKAPSQDRPSYGYRAGSGERYRRDNRDQGGYGGRSDSRDRPSRDYRRDQDYRREDSRDRGRWEERRGYDQRDYRDYRPDSRDRRGFDRRSSPSPFGRRDQSRGWGNDRGNYNNRGDQNDRGDQNNRGDRGDRYGQNNGRSNNSRYVRDESGIRNQGNSDNRNNRGDGRDRNDRGNSGNRNNRGNSGGRNNQGNDGSRNNRGDSGSRDNFRSLKTEDEFSESDVDNAVLNACADVVKRRSKRSGRPGNE